LLIALYGHGRVDYYLYGHDSHAALEGEYKVKVADQLEQIAVQDKQIEEQKTESASMQEALEMAQVEHHKLTLEIQGQQKELEESQQLTGGLTPS